MPLPYMGSKRKSAGKIYQAIKNLNPDATTIVDLFCGGFAISEYFIKNGWNVIANDKNKYVVALLDQTINKGLDEEVCLKFITREKFQDVLANPDNYADWYVGYVMCLWSFGNTQSAYLFGKEAEPYKHAGHELVVYKNLEPIQKLIDIPQKYIDGILKQADWHKSRIALNRVSKKLKTRIFELERLQQLEQLEQLERLQQLERLERLQFYSGDYSDVCIPRGAVVYCDPPYKGTAEYAEGAFNHKEFWEYVRKLSKTNPVYVSEYNAPDDFVPILKFPQKSTLQGGVQKHNKQPDECLFKFK